MGIILNGIILLFDPARYHSVHGVKSSGEFASKFESDEYVVYDTAQLRIQYLIEYAGELARPSHLPTPLIADSFHSNNKEWKEVVSKKRITQQGLISSDGYVVV